MRHIVEAYLLKTATTTATRSSGIVDIRGAVLGSLHVISTGTLVGTSALKFGNAPDGASIATTVDTTLLAQLAAMDAAILNGTPGSYIIENIPISSSWLQYVFTFGSSTGNLTVYFTGKQ